MNTELKRKWIAALRSGKYKQTAGSLCRTDNKGKPAAYCCLGVLCEVIHKHDQSVEPDVVNNNAAFYIDNKTGRSLHSSLDQQLRHRIDMKKLDHDCLLAMNDSGKDFKYIATYIKDNM